MANVAKGQMVTFSCSSYAENGTCLDDPHDQEPFSMKAGMQSKQRFSASISQALVGMTVDQSKEFTVLPQDAFGAKDPNKVYRVTVEQSDSYKIGQPFKLKMTQGSEVSLREGVITKVQDGYINVDTNHPLAGQTISVRIKILGITN